ncbi:hypothetical protein C0995_001178 [Termitomyces sp. Mi166|nr:hypothetical protein C0995_001178 [Termitomyces sp. Mi166\
MASTLLQGLNPARRLFEQAMAHEHLAPSAPSVPVEEDVHCKYTLSYVNEPDIGTALKQARPELE